MSLSTQETGWEVSWAHRAEEWPLAGVKFNKVKQRCEARPVQERPPGLRGISSNVKEEKTELP